VREMEEARQSKRPRENVFLEKKDTFVEGGTRGGGRTAEDR